jgi:hypothetical protein
MSSELAILIGAGIGIVGSLGTTLFLKILEYSRRAKSIRAIAAAEVTSIKEKAQRFLDGKSSLDEFSASSPMLVAIANELGYMSPSQVIAFRRTITLDMEVQKQGNKEKAQTMIDACDRALALLGF